ncbi:hypothetical protein, partial [Pseudomonas jessenii]|uniref:hypothetical protein n=1 Tax=Pseudomonas jessenii TaxID=77298 RepID=UPI0030BEA120
WSKKRHKHRNRCPGLLDQFKLAPTGIEYICKISVGWLAAFASKLAPTEEQKQIGVHRRFSPLIRPSVSSPAAFDLDPPAPSAG